MDQYLTRHMVARKPLAYVGRELQPGDTFIATPNDGDYFVRNGSAADSAEAPKAPAVPVAAAPPPMSEVQDEAPAAPVAPDAEEAPAAEPAAAPAPTRRTSTRRVSR